MSQQLVKKGTNGKHENVMPRSWIEAIKDKNTGQTLVEILQGFNMYFLPYNGNTTSTRCLIPTILRKKGLWITYVKYDGNVYTEWYAADEIDDKSWGDSSNWRIGNNTLVGDITISSNGNWVINGTETEFKAVGEKGNTPLLRVANNRLQVSYDLGDTYIDVTNNPVYTKFRWLATSGDTQANNVGRIQASTDEGKTWTNMSNDFTNNLHISRYIGVNESLPTSGIAEGTIYAKGPYYAEDDALNDNPIYRLWVYAWKGNTLAWQDNGEFTSISAGVVQETGNSETEVMSQKAVSKWLEELENYIFNTPIASYTSELELNNIDGSFIGINGKLYNNISYSYSKPIKLEKGTIMIFTSPFSNYSVVPISETDSNGTFYKPLVRTTSIEKTCKFFYYANNDIYIALSYPKDGVKKAVTIKGYASGILEYIKRIDEYTFNNTHDLNSLPIIIKEKDGVVKKGYYITNTGIKGEGAFPGYQIKVYEVKDEELIFVGTRGRGKIVAAALFTDEELSNMVSYYGWNENNTVYDYRTVIKIPIGVKYLVTTQYVEDIDYYFSAYEFEYATILDYIINQQKQPLKIINWGDSLTVGAGGDGTTYTNVLQDLLGSQYKLINCGVGGETTYTIAARQGSIPMCLSNDIIIPANTEKVKINITNYFNKNISILSGSGNGNNINPCIIDGIEGLVTKESDTYYFTRLNTGKERHVPSKTIISTRYMTTYDLRNPFGNVFWAGTNGEYESIDDLINQYKSMVGFAGNNNYIIIGLHLITKAIPLQQREEEEKYFEREFGSHYINLRKYLTSNALADAGIEPTELDLAAISKGLCPPSLLVDSVHFNSIGYKLIAALIYNKLKELGITK